LKGYNYKNQLTRSLTDQFFNHYNFSRKTLYFKNLLYVFILLKCAWWFLNYSILFGDHAIAFTKSLQGTDPIRSIAYLLYAAKNSHAGLYVLCGISLLCILGLLKYRIWVLSDLILWLLLINVHNKIYTAITGGEHLLNQLALFNIFLCTTFITERKFFSELKCLFHNFACYALILQICFVYLVSGYAKLRDDIWLEGNAVEIILQVDHFNLWGARFPESISNALNYIILFYQLLFPLLVWFRFIKKPLLMFGIIFHLYVAFGMGLVSFGLVMILPYVYFWPMKDNN
jgi:hypothetical protein